MLMNDEASQESGMDSGDPWGHGAVLPDTRHLNPNVLFIDDDAYMRRLMTARLAYLGAQVEPVPGAQAAMAYLESHRPDLIVCDAVMPGTDGFDLCRQIKANPLLQDIPFLILTALKGDIRTRSIQAGADDYLSKLEHEVVFRMRARLALELGLRVAAQGGEPEPAAGPSLLVVSPSRAIQAQMETHLQKDGIQVQGATTLAEAFDSIQADRPDLVAADFALGPQEILDWIVRLRALAGRAAVPVMALAARDEDDRLAELEGYIKDRLLKPLDGQEGRHRVNLLLRIHRM
jgi:two-component system cell cycle response regulator